MLKNLSKTEIIGWLVTIILVLTLLLIPEQGIYTTTMKYFFAVTIGGLSLAAFELVPILVISLLMPALWFYLKVAPLSTIMSPWLTTTPLLILGALFLSETLKESGLLERLAIVMLSKTNSSYFILLLIFMLTTVILNIATFGKGYFITAPLAAGLYTSLSKEQKNKNLGVGLASAVMLGGCTSHIYTYQPVNWGIVINTAIANGFIISTDITPLKIIMHNWPMFFVSIGILWVISKWYRSENLNDLQTYTEKLNALGKITKKEKANLFMLIILLCYVFTVDFHGLPLEMGFMIIPLIVYLPGIDGASFQTVKNVNYEMLLFVTACMGIGSVATNLGLSDILASFWNAILNGSSNVFAMMAIVFIVVFVLNFLMTPTAIFAVITVPICLMAVDAGYSVIPFLYAASACSEAIIFPYEYVPYLIVYAFGMISMKDFIITNIFRSVVIFASYFVILIPFWMLNGLF